MNNLRDTMVVTVAQAVALSVVAMSASVAHALPRFAARTGNECIQCHVNPSGGGVRNAYGRNVFERMWLSLDTTNPDQSLSLDLTEQDLADLEANLAAEEEGPSFWFSGDVTEWLALGGDFRVAYLWIRPDGALPPATEPNITSSFFLMQAYLYTAATLHENVQLVLQLGVYSGFEAWGLFRLFEEGAEYNLLAKVGRFMPAFGIREVEHQLFTRERIGLGNADRDTGLEVTGFAGPVTAQVSLLNGTFGDLSLDSSGPDRRTFEMAVVARVAVRADLGWGRGQLGGSFSFSGNNNQANPLFSGAIPSEYSSSAGQGVDELRAGAFLSANIGRFTYLADVVYVRDEFYEPGVPVFEGYASYQELSFLPVQGLDVVVMFEFMDPNIGLANNSIMRGGLAIEFFPLPFTEVRLMARRMWNDSSPTGGSWDVVAFVHLFM